MPMFSHSGSFHPSRILWKIGKSSAAAKVIEEKALEILKQLDLKQLKGLAREYETDAVQALRRLHPADRATLILSDNSLGLGRSYLEHAGLDTSKYTIENWKLILHEPLEFDLPAGGKFKLSEINLKKPAAIAAASACYQVRGCIEQVQKLHNAVTSPNNELSNSD